MLTLQKRILILLILLANLMIVACSILGTSPICNLPQHKIIDDSSTKLLWSKTDMYVPNSGTDPLIRGLASHVFIVTMPNGSSSLTSFDDQSGTLLWQQIEDSDIGSMVATDNGLYVGNVDKIKQYDPKTENLINEIASINVGQIDPEYFAEGKLFSFAPGSGRSLTYNTVTKKVEISAPNLSYTPFVIEGGVLYLIDVDGFKAEDADTQKLLWNYSIGEQITNPLFADNVIMIPSSSGNIYIINKATGTLIAKLNDHAISTLKLPRAEAQGFLEKHAQVQLCSKSFPRTTNG